MNPRFEHYDLRSRNPYGDRLSTCNLSPDSTFKLLSLAIPAGEEVGAHTVTSPAHLFVIEGRVDFIAGADAFTMMPGSVVHIPVGQIHRIVALEDSHCILVR